MASSCSLWHICVRSDFRKQVFVGGINQTANAVLAWCAVTAYMVALCTPVDVCVLKNWGMMFIHRNQANLQAFKSVALKCQHSKLHIWICSIIISCLPLLLLLFFFVCFITFTIFYWILNTWQWWWLCASSVSALGNAVCVNRGTWNFKEYSASSARKFLFSEMLRLVFNKLFHKTNSPSVLVTFYRGGE